MLIVLKIVHQGDFLPLVEIIFLNKEKEVEVGK